MDDTNNPAANQFKDLLSSFGLSQHVHEPTHKHGHYQKPPLPSVSTKARNLKEIDIHQFSEDVKSAFAATNFEECTLDICGEKYETVLQAVLDKHAPVKKKDC